MVSSGGPHTGSSPLRVGNGAGFWGDNLDAPFLLAHDGRIDFLTLEYLAELTMAILSHLRARQHSRVRDRLSDLLERLAPLLREQGALRIVTNAGGLNPPSCAVASGRHLGRADLGDLAIGIVAGDDVLEQIPEWMNSGLTLDHLETGEPLSMVADRLQMILVSARNSNFTDAYRASFVAIRWESSDENSTVRGCG